MENRVNEPNYVDYWDDEEKVGIYAMKKGVLDTVWIIRIYTDRAFSARAIGMFKFSDNKEADALLKKILEHTTPERLKRIHTGIKEYARNVQREFEKKYVHSL